MLSTILNNFTQCFKDLVDAITFPTVVFSIKTETFITVYNCTTIPSSDETKQVLLFITKWSKMSNHYYNFNNKECSNIFKEMPKNQCMQRLCSELTIYCRKNNLANMRIY